MNRKALLLTFVWLAGCSATYRADQITEQVKKVSHDEYNVDPEVKLVGKTLSARVLVDNPMSVLLSSEEGDGKKAWDLMTVLSRVCLSTDAPVDFFVVVAADRQNPDNRFMFVRYVEDVKRVMLDDISRNEFFDGTLVEFRLKGKTYFIDPSDLDFLKVLLLALNAEKEPALQAPEPWATDVDLPDFLARVAAQRLKRALSEDVRASDRFVVRQVDGRYELGTGRFFFRLDLVRKPQGENEPAESASGSAGMIGDMVRAARVSLHNLHRKPPVTVEKDILPFSAGEVEKFFRHYNFTNFSSVEIEDVNSGRSLTMPFH